MQTSTLTVIVILKHNLGLGVLQFTLNVNFEFERREDLEFEMRSCKNC